jgi:hypothetical protein
LDDRIVFLNAVSAHVQDVYSVPIAGGQWTRVTNSGRIGQASIGRSGVAYYEPVDGDATSVWFLPAGTAVPQQIYDAEGSNMVAGDGFVAWASNTAILARSTRPGASAATTLVKNWSVIARMSADGDRLVFGERIADSEDRAVGQRLHLVTLAQASSSDRLSTRP